MFIYDNCLGGYVYIKYATESPKTGASNKLYITCRHAGYLFKFKHNMSRGSFSWHILPTSIVGRSVCWMTVFCMQTSTVDCTYVCRSAWLSACNTCNGRVGGHDLVNKHT